MLQPVVGRRSPETAWNASVLSGQHTSRELGMLWYLPKQRTVCARKHFAFIVFNLGFSSSCVCCSIFVLEEMSQCNRLCFQSWEQGDLSWCFIPGGHNQTLGTPYPCGGKFDCAWGRVVSAVIFVAELWVMSSLKPTGEVSVWRRSLDTFTGLMM